MTMTRCPVCDEEQYADEMAFNHHVNSHFAGDGFASAGPSRLSRGRSDGLSPRGRRCVSLYCLQICLYLADLPGLRSLVTRISRVRRMP